MTPFSKISQVLDDFDRLSSKESLFDAVSSILSALQERPESTDGEIHKSAVVMPKPTLLDYCLKRAIKGTAVESQRTQRNFMVLSHAVLELCHERVPTDRLLSFLSSELSPSNSINKTERIFFAFAFVSLTFKVRELTSEDCDDAVFKPTLARLHNLLKKVPFARKFVAGELAQAPLLDSFHVALMDRVVEELKPSSCFDFELLASIKVHCLDSLKALTDPDCRKKCTRIALRVNDGLKECFSAKFLVRLFEDVNLNPNFQEEEDTASVYALLAQLFVAHKDLKLSKMLALFEAVQRNDGANPHSQFKRHANFAFLLTEYLDRVPDLDGLVAHCAALKCSDTLVAMVHSLLTNRFIKSKRSAFAWEFAQRTLAARLQRSGVACAEFQLLLLRLIFGQKDLMGFGFPVKDVLLHKLDNGEVKCRVLGELLAARKGGAAGPTVAEYKQAVSRVTVLLSAVLPGDPQTVGQALGQLFADYADSAAVVSKEDLRDHSREYLVAEVQEHLFERLSQLIFKKGFRKAVRDTVEQWVEVNGVEDEFNNLGLASELFALKDRRAESLAVLNAFLMFRNYRAQDQGVESLIFDQSVEDVSIFSQNFLSGEQNVNSGDFCILTDVLVSLLNCPSHEIREIVREVFESFSHLVNEQVFSIVENAVFKEDAGAEAEDDDLDSESEDESVSEERQPARTRKDTKTTSMNDDGDSGQDEEVLEEQLSDEEEDIVIEGNLF